MASLDAAAEDVAISVVNTSNRDLLRVCLASLPDACQGLAWSATVVDNASTDGSAAMVREQFPWARLLENAVRMGFSANHNQVIRPALGDGRARYLLVLNEDTELDPDSVRKLVEYADAHPRVGVVGPVIRGTDGDVQPSEFPFPEPLDYGMNFVLPRRGNRQAPDLKAGSPRWLNGSCLLIRADALRHVGTLDERFFIFFEDTDLGLRFEQAGWSSAICPTAGIVHHGHQTVSRASMSMAMERQQLRSTYLYYDKHYGHGVATRMSAVVRASFLLRSAKAAIHGRLARSASERHHAKVLGQLARYRPSDRLPHEVAAQVRADERNTS